MPETPRLKNDCFALPAGTNWTPVDDALAHLRQHMRCVVKPESLPIGQAEGRVLAAPVKAARANPPYANAAVDGYGFAHAALTSGAESLPLVTGRSAAGHPMTGRCRRARRCAF